MGRVRLSLCRRGVWLFPVLCGVLMASPAVAQEDGEFEFAQHLLHDGMYDLAGQQLQLYITNHPNSPRTSEAFLLLADAYVARGALAKAADTYQGFIIKYPQDVRVREFWLKEAELRARAGQYAEAARAYTELADAYSESDFADDALLGAGSSLVQLGEFERAERALTRLLDRYPRSSTVPRARVLLGTVRLARGDAAGAQQIIEPVLRVQNLNNDVADALALGTQTALRLNQVAEARRLSDRLVAQAPGDDRTWRTRTSLAEYLLSQGEATRNIEFLNQAADCYKETARRATTPATGEAALFDLARVRELQQTPALALSNWQDFLQQYPRSPRRPRAMLGLGRAHFANGNERAGVFALEELLTAYPDSAESIEALGLLGDYYLGRKDPASAIVYYERQLAKTPEGTAHRRRMLRNAEVRETSLGETEQARALYAELAGEEDDVAANALFGLARCCRSLGQIDAAEEAYHQVTRRFPNHPLASAAQDSLTLIRLFLRPDVSGAILATISLESEQMVSRADAATVRREQMLGLARIKITYLKDYQGAIALLRAYLAEQNIASPDEAEHLLAQCYLRLSTRAELEHDSTAQAAAQQEALAALARLAARYPQSNLADDAFIETTEASLASVDSAAQPRRILEAYKDFFTRYPQSDRRDFVLVRIAESTVALARTGVGSPDEALRQFDEALRIAPGGAVLDRALFGSALILAQQGGQDEARLRLERLIAERPLSALVPESRYQLALILLDQKQPRAAARELEKLLHLRQVSRDPNEIRMKLVQAYEMVADFQAVVPVAQEMAASNAPTPAAWGARHLASALIQLRKPAEAEHALAAELAARPGAPDADSLTILRARILLDQHDLNKVSNVLSGFERNYPRSAFVPDAWRMLADVQFELGSVEEALANYRRAIQAHPDDKAARMGEVVSLYRLGRASEAQGRERALRDLGPLSADDEVRLAIEQGYALNRARDFVGSINAFARVVEQNPQSQWADDALLALGKVAAGSGRVEPAVQAFERLIGQYPDSPLRQEAMFELGNTYMRSQFYEQAAEAYTRLLEQDTTSQYAPDAMWNLILAYEQMQRLDSAIRTMRMFLLKYPNHEKATRVWVKIANDLNQLGEFQDAVTAYQQALDHVSGTSEEPDARFGLGEVYYNLAQYRQAVVEWLKLAYHSQSQSRWGITARFRAARANEKMGQIEDARTLYRQIITIEGEGSDMGRAAAQQLMVLNEAASAGRRTSGSP